MNENDDLWKFVVKVANSMGESPLFTDSLKPAYESLGELADEAQKVERKWGRDLRGNKVVPTSPVMGRVVPNKPYVPDHIHGGA